MLNQDKLAPLSQEWPFLVAKKVVMLRWKVVNIRFGPKGKKDQKGPHSFSGLPTGRKSRECQWKVTGESPINMSMSIYSS